MMRRTRMGTAYNQDRGPKLAYENLVRIARTAQQPPALSLTVQRYQAVVAGEVVGSYSSLAMAYKEVELAVPRGRLMTWEIGKWEGQTDYVLDHLTGRTHLRVGDTTGPTPPTPPRETDPPVEAEQWRQHRDRA